MGETRKDGEHAPSGAICQGVFGGPCCRLGALFPDRNAISPHLVASKQDSAFWLSRGDTAFSHAIFHDLKLGSWPNGRGGCQYITPDRTHC